MKKLFIIFASGLLLLSSCGTRDDEAVKKDAVTCVREFIQAAVDQDEQTALSLIGGVEETKESKWQLLKRFRPQLNTESVTISENVGLIKKSDTNISSCIVTANYQYREIKFIVRFGGNTGREGNPQVYEFYDFMDFDTNKYFDENGYYLKKGRDIDDMTFAQYYDSAKETESLIKSYLSTLNSGQDGYEFYPSSRGFHFVADSLISISEIEINKREHSAIYYKVECTKNISFEVETESKGDNEKRIITKSTGLYPFEEMLSNLVEIYGINSSNYQRPIDTECEDVIKKAESDGRQKAEEEAEKRRQEEYKQNRRAYWERIGLVINEVKMISGYETKGISFRVTNPTEKTIKYVVAHINGINQVGDRCTSIKTCRGIGPIAPRETGTYEFDDVFSDKNDIIDDISVIFQVVYMNGGTKIVRLKDANTNSNEYNEGWWN